MKSPIQDTGLAPKHEKLWGAEYWLTNATYCMKVLELQPGYQCSKHYHEQKDETFLVTRGTVHIEIGNQPDELMLEGDYVRLAPGVPHRFWTTDPDGATVVEASTHHSETDVVRLATSRKRCDICKSFNCQDMCHGLYPEYPNKH